MPYNYTAAVANPQSRLDISPRFDFQLGPNNTLTRALHVRPPDSRPTAASRQFALANPGLQRIAITRTRIQLSDTQVLEREHSQRDALSIHPRRATVRPRRAPIPPSPCRAHSPAAAATRASVRDNQDRFELQNNTIISKGAHSIKFGTRLRLTARRQLLHLRLQRHITSTRIARRTTRPTRPSEYDVTDRHRHSSASTSSTPAVFFQDDLQAPPQSHPQLRPALRGAELTSAIMPTGRPASRSPGRPGQRQCQQDRHSRAATDGSSIASTPTTFCRPIRQNGINQQQYVVKNPTFYQNAPHAVARWQQLAPRPHHLYQVAPNLQGLTQHAGRDRR